jgi:hypothetical protein
MRGAWCARFLVVAIVLWAGPAVGAMRRLILSRDCPLGVGVFLILLVRQAKPRFCLLS